MTPSPEGSASGFPPSARSEVRLTPSSALARSCHVILRPSVCGQKREGEKTKLISAHRECPHPERETCQHHQISETPIPPSIRPSSFPPADELMQSSSIRARPTGPKREVQGAGESGEVSDSFHPHARFRAGGGGGRRTETRELTDRPTDSLASDELSLARVVSIVPRDDGRRRRKVRSRKERRKSDPAPEVSGLSAQSVERHASTKQGMKRDGKSKTLRG